jgi:hypothetical protein
MCVCVCVCVYYYLQVSVRSSWRTDSAKGAEFKKTILHPLFFYLAKGRQMSIVPGKGQCTRVSFRILVSGEVHVIQPDS